MALQAIGAPAVAECTYSFPATDAKTFLTLASVIEGVGVSAYLGAAMDIMSADYLTAAAQIAPVEARHTAYFRKELGEAGMPNPFDTPLDMDQVYTLASPFIVGCPSSNPPLPVKVSVYLPRLSKASTTNTPILRLSLQSLSLPLVLSRQAKPSPLRQRPLAPSTPRSRTSLAQFSCH